MKYVNVWEQPQKYMYLPQNQKTNKLGNAAQHLKKKAENLITKTKEKF